MKYIDFAAKISFYEFLQDEFYKPHFKTSLYKEEIAILKKDINIDVLTREMETRPKLIDIFEELFQLKNFTNTQYLNFCFDVNLLNNADESTVIKYIHNRVFKFENGKENTEFKNIYKKHEEKLKNNQEIIFNTKRAMIDYIDKVKSKKNRKILYEHLINSIEARLRVSKYVIENLNAKDYISSINVQMFLDSKRHPKDTKGLHGNFGSYKIIKILKDNEFIDVQKEIKDKELTHDSLLSDKFKNKYCYARELSIKGVMKRKDKKEKVFDFVLFYNKKPVILIETNFYTTSGTKIGINEGEYTDLLEDIDVFNKKDKGNFKFIWITDGNYWLLKDGENRYNNLKQNFFKKDYELLNYNLFKEYIDKIKKEMK